LGANDECVVCVVDDDEAVRDSLLVLLQSEDLPVCAFASAAELLASGIALHSVACFVIDVHMPGMGGLDLLRHLRAGGVTAPVFMLTGAGNDALRREAMAAGATAVLAKPTGALLERIRGVIGRA
jgi:FixJ family two-component response regulator